VFYFFSWRDIGRDGYEMPLGHTYERLKSRCSCYTEVEAVESLWNKIQREKATTKAVEKELSKRKLVRTGRILWSKKAVQSLYESLEEN
jgi:hypothetical protein